MDRRTVLKAVALASVSPAWAWTRVEAETAFRAASAARAAGDFEPAFFTAAEYATVVLLADMILPADERSVSASDAGVPEFIDFMMIDRPARQDAMRGGLGWLDREAHERFGARFTAATDAQRAAILDDIAWPARARPERSHGVAFFSAFRDLVATGFWSSKVGVEDLQYRGNTVVLRWDGCPPAALHKLGVSYDEGGE